MKKILFLLILLGIEKAIQAQHPTKPYIYTIKADSIKITNDCDTAELIIPAAGTAYAATGLDATGPWGWVGHGITTLAGGIVGGFAGEAITETVYDHIVTIGVKPGMK